MMSTTKKILQKETSPILSKHWHWSMNDWPPPKILKLLSYIISYIYVLSSLSHFSCLKIVIGGTLSTIRGKSL